MALVQKAGLIKICSVTVAYIALAYLGLKLALPPGYATAIWPPSGMALAAVLIWGRRTSLGVFLGSLVSNLLISTNYFSSEIQVASVGLAASIAMGSTAQALFGCMLTRRLMQNTFNLDDLKSTVTFLLSGAVLSCLIGATWGVSSLLAFDMIKQQAVASSWLAWWVGDSLGVLVFTPIFFCIFANGNVELWKRRRLTLLIPTGTAFALITLAFWYSSRWEQLRANFLFQQSARSIEAAIVNQVDTFSHNIALFASYFQVPGKVTSKEFKKISQQFLNINQGMFALSWNAYLESHEYADFEREVRSEGFQDFKVFNLDKKLSNTSAESIPSVVVKYIEPYENNKKAHGLNIASNPERLKAIQRALKEGRAIATEKINLFQDGKTFDGLLLLHPVYAGGTANVWTGQASPKPIGFLVGVMKISAMMDIALKGLDLEGIEVAVFDEDSSSERFELYSSHNVQQTRSDYIKKKESSSYIPVKTSEFTFGGRNYSTFIFKTESSWVQQRSLTASVVLIGGLLFVGSIEIFLLVLTGRNAIIEAAVRQKEQSERELEHRVIERTQELKIAKEVAEKSERIKAAFLANMSHEIRTPLNGILGLTSIIQEEELPNEIRERLETIIFCADNLMVVINDILDFSKIESGMLEISASSFSLRQELSKCIKLYCEKAKEKEDVIAVNYPEHLPDWILTDGTRIFQILSNLLSNAIKFSSQSEVGISIEFAALASDQLELTIAVKDQGIGIPLEKQNSIFQPFTQADSSISRRYGGTGLGLSISKRLAQLLGGDLTYTSQEGVGTTFILKVPVNRSVPSAGQSSLPTAPRVSFSDLDLRILVAEDNAVNQQIAEIYLKKMGLSADFVGNGKEAVESVQKKAYNLIFMDMQMPIMGGVEATKEVRKLFGSDEICIVAMTANVMQDQREECVAAGMDDFIGKPMRIKDIAEVIERHFRSVPAKTKSA